jgi:hypothetical protein
MSLLAAIKAEAPKKQLTFWPGGKRKELARKCDRCCLKPMAKAVAKEYADTSRAAKVGAKHHT